MATSNYFPGTKVWRLAPVTKRPYFAEIVKFHADANIYELLYFSVSRGGMVRTHASPSNIVEPSNWALDYFPEWRVYGPPTWEEFREDAAYCDVRDALEKMEANNGLH